MDGDGGDKRKRRIGEEALERFGKELYRDKGARKEDRKEIEYDSKYPHLFKPKASKPEGEVAHKPQDTDEERKGDSHSEGR